MDPGIRKAGGSPGRWEVVSTCLAARSLQDCSGAKCQVVAEHSDAALDGTVLTPEQYTRLWHCHPHTEPWDGEHSMETGGTRNKKGRSGVQQTPVCPLLQREQNPPASGKPRASNT